MRQFVVAIVNAALLRNGIDFEAAGQAAVGAGLLHGLHDVGIIAADFGDGADHILHASFRTVRR